MINTRTVALVGAVLSCAACSRSSGPIEIGLAGPLSQPRGVAMQQGAQLAIEQINARGGVRGRPLKLRLANDSANEDAAVRVAQTLYDNPAVVAVAGHLTSDASIAAALVELPTMPRPSGPNSASITCCTRVATSIRSMNGS